MREPQYERGDAQRGEPRNHNRYEQRTGHDERAEIDEPPRRHTIREFSDQNGEQHRAQGIERDHHADRELIRGQLQRVQRDRDAAAAEAGLTQKRHQYDRDRPSLPPAMGAQPAPLSRNGGLVNVLRTRHVRTRSFSSRHPLESPFR